MEKLLGQKYGKLTPIERTRKNKNGKYYYLCICECGNTKEILGESIRSGNTKSCGCIKTQRVRNHAKIMGKENAKDLSGQKFGRLTAILPTDKRSHSHSVIWECVCDCGVKTFVDSRNLLGGTVKSCGCYNKDNLQRIYSEQFVENTKLGALYQKISKRNTSGVKGVSWDLKTQTWKVQIGFKGKNIYLGRYKNFEDAVKSRKTAEEKYFDPILKRYNKLN